MATYPEIFVLKKLLSSSSKLSFTFKPYTSENDNPFPFFSKILCFDMKVRDHRLDRSRYLFLPLSSFQDLLRFIRSHTMMTSIRPNISAKMNLRDVGRRQIAVRYRLCIILLLPISPKYNHFHFY